MTAKFRTALLVNLAMVVEQANEQVGWQVSPISGRQR